MPKALVTGGAGFVGRNLIYSLLNSGYEVTCVDNLVENTGFENPDLGWSLFEPRDFANFNWINQDCREFFSENIDYFDYIFHLAAVVGGRLTIERDPLSVAIDLAIDAEMWRWATIARPKKVVYFSSSAAYPINLQTNEAETIALREDFINLDSHLGMPDMTYGWAKLTGEYLSKIAWQKYGINSAVYRPFSGYGKDQSLNYPFTSICQRALDTIGQSKFTVWGSGQQSRDFIHIKDCIEGVLSTMEVLNEGDALNLSTGTSTSFIELARLATEAVGWNPSIIGDENFPSGVFSRIGDTEKQRKLNFDRRIPLKDGVLEVIEFLDTRKNKVRNL